MIKDSSFLTSYDCFRKNLLDINLLAHRMWIFAMIKNITATKFPRIAQD